MEVPSRRLAAVWFADIVSYTALSRSDEDAALLLVELFESVVRETTAAHGGTVAKFVGDGVLAYAPSASSALDAMVELRDQFQLRAAETAGGAQLRIGGHIGDLVISGSGDVFGDGVNVASRLQTASGPGQIYLSEDLWRQCRQRSVHQFAVVGPRKFKGIEEPVIVYELSPSQSHFERSPDTDGKGRSRSVAILPFELVGTSEDAAFLASGIHNDLLTELSKYPDLTVISRTSVMGYRQAAKSIPIIARELNVGTIVEGIVQSAGNRVRVTVQLIDGETDIHRWAEYFDRELSTEALLEIQTELTERVVESLQAQLAPTRAGRADGPATPDLEAYRLVVEGRMQFDRKTEDGLSRAMELFGQAIEADPDYGMAWAGLADSQAIMADYGYGDRESLVASAKAAVARAVELLPGSGAPHTSLGLIAESLHDAPTALKEYEITIGLDPGHADAHSWHAWISLITGEGEQALTSATRSVELNPLSAEAVTNLALAHLAVGDPAAAANEARRASEISPGYTTALYYSGLALYDLGRFSEAVDVLSPQSMAHAGSLTTPWASMGPDAALALAQIRVGSRDHAANTLETIDPAVYPFEAGLVHAGLGDLDNAYHHFDQLSTTPYGPTLIFHHHFRDVWETLDHSKLEHLADVVYRSWGMEPPTKR